MKIEILLFRLALLQLCLMSFSLNTYTQNMVINGSFEQYSSCPDNVVQINKAIGWFGMDGFGGSSEYFNECDNPNPLGTPDNWAGSQIPKTGKGYVGTAFFELASEYCEYIEGTLSSPLNSGTCYTASFHISLADIFNPGIDAIGMYFTNDSLLYMYFPLEVVPQVQNDSLNIITDKINWVKIQGSFIASGGEKFLTIGRFKRNEYVTYDHSQPLPGMAYYYIDDVSVYPCDATNQRANCGADVCSLPGQNITIGTHDLPEYNYNWFDKDSANIGNSAFLEITPSESTVYYLRVQDFKYEVSWDTVNITISDNCDPAPVYIPNVFSPNGDGNNDVLFVRGDYNPQIDFKIFNRWGSMVYESNDIRSGWDGRFQGKDCAEGVYAFMLSVTNNDGETALRKGNITLIR